jgi:hypothetical protein
MTMDDGRGKSRLAPMGETALSRDKILEELARTVVAMD